MMMRSVLEGGMFDRTFYALFAGGGNDGFYSVRLVDAPACTKKPVDSVALEEYRDPGHDALLVRRLADDFRPPSPPVLRY